MFVCPHTHMSYINMICLDCKKQMPDDSSKCPHCGTEVFHKHQIKKEISLRRWQRWIFYGIIIIIILIMVGIIVKITNSNSKLLLEVTNIQKITQEKITELEDVSSKTYQLESLKNVLEAEKSQLNDDLTEKEEELKEKLEEIEKQIDQKLIAQGVIDRIKEITAKNVVSTSTINKIKLADIIYTGTDSDKDGIIDDLEDVIGTDKNKADTDDDGYSDRSELMDGYNPIGDGDFGTEEGAGEQYKGKLITVQVGTSTQSWYIGLEGHKYFLGIID